MSQIEPLTGLMCTIGLANGGVGGIAIKIIGRTCGDKLNVRWTR